MWGTALDHVLEVEVVTANGSIVRANETRHEDLFFVSHIPIVFLSLLMLTYSDFNL